MEKYSLNGKFRGRVIPRFGMCQGLKIHPDGTTSQKIRCIDDARIAGTNEGTIIPERVVLPSFEVAGKVAGEIFRITDSAPKSKPSFGSRRHSECLLEIWQCVIRPFYHWRLQRRHQACGVASWIWPPDGLLLQSLELLPNSCSDMRDCAVLGGGDRA